MGDPDVVRDLLNALDSALDRDDFAVLRKIDCLQLTKKTLLLLLNHAEESQSGVAVVEEVLPTLDRVLNRSAETLIMAAGANKTDSYIMYPHLQIVRLILDLMITSGTERTPSTLLERIATHIKDFSVQSSCAELLGTPLVDAAGLECDLVLRLIVGGSKTPLTLNSGKLTGSAHFGEFSVVFFAERLEIAEDILDEAADASLLEIDLKQTAVEIPVAVLLETSWPSAHSLCLSLVDLQTIANWTGLAAVNEELITSAECMQVILNFGEGTSLQDIQMMTRCTGPCVHTPAQSPQKVDIACTTLEEPDAPRKGAATPSPKRVSFGRDSPAPPRSRLRVADEQPISLGLVDTFDLDAIDLLEETEPYLGSTGGSQTPIPIQAPPVSVRTTGRRTSLSALRSASIDTEQQGGCSLPRDMSRRLTTSTTASDYAESTPPHRSLPALWTNITREECCGIISNSVSPLLQDDEAQLEECLASDPGSRRLDERYRALFRRASHELKQLENRAEEQLVATLRATNIELKKGKELQLRCSKELAALLASSNKLSDELLSNLMSALDEHHKETKQARECVLQNVKTKIDELVKKRQRLA